jgi:3-isopropylmalate/(R)-2-methylmalate dehydratase small subunit
LPIRLSEEQVDTIFQRVRATPGYRLRVDLERKTITSADGIQYSFEVEDFRRHCLLNGLDDIGLTMVKADKIKDFESKAAAARPWA